MILAHLALSNVRNYQTLDLDPEPGLNLFIGANAQGKSNLLEALSMLGTGKSFRAARDREIVREGLELAVMRGIASTRSGLVELACSIAQTERGSRKTYTINGHAVRYARYLGTLRVVTFVPSDLQLVAGPPSLRRGFLNAALAQDRSDYYRALAEYRTALAQKNAVLRAESVDTELLAIYEEQLIESGTAIVLARDRFVRELAVEAARAHGRFAADRERLAIAYAPNAPYEVPTDDAVAAGLRAALRVHARSERARRIALVGPHRDDLVLHLDARPLAAFGSQGQQRTAVLALKVAEYAVMERRADEAPLLLLDDVLSELDAERASAFLAGIGAFEQAFVTSALPIAGPLHPARTWNIRAARIEAVAC